jgi:hypothetical protein
MIEAASQWDEEYFKIFVTTLRNAYQSMGREFPELNQSWASLGLCVASRTTDSGSDFPIYGGQMEQAVSDATPTVTRTGMTKIMTDTRVTAGPYPQKDQKSLAGKALNDNTADINYGANSLMRRYTVKWNSTQVEGTNLVSRDVPFGLLGLADQQNVQNMPFTSFLYSVTDVKIVFQVNGTPTQAGMCICYHVPLNTGTPDRGSKPSYNHTWLRPCQNSTSELYINFRYWRSALNSTNAAFFKEVLGSIKVDVFSPLVSVAAGNCDITMFVSFDANFKIPRPIPVAPTTGVAPAFGFARDPNGALLAASGSYVAQGSNVSTTNVTNSYSVGNIGGDMPIQAGVDGGGKLSQDGKVDASIPMDNPPLAGGSVPIAGQFSSMSKSNGVEVTTALQLHQAEMSYQPISIRDGHESLISEICGKQGFLTRFSWSAVDIANTNKLTLRLDSLFDFLGTSSSGLTYTTIQYPVNVAVLNQFSFWRADIVFDLCVVKTSFHSGRLLASVCYGDDSINPSELNVYINHALDFVGDSDWASFKVEYNNSQEFIRTNNGRGVARNRDYSVGSVAFTVLNELKATSEVVSGTVDVLVFVRFENVRVAVPRPCPLINFGTDATPYHAQGDAIGDKSGGEDVAGPETTVATTSANTRLPSNKPCKLTFGEKFDYCVTDVHELVRRHIPISLRGPQRANLTYSPPWYLDKYAIRDDVEATPTDYDVYRFVVQPISDWNRLFMGWSGHIKYRIFVYGARPGLVWYTPQDYNENFTTNDDFVDMVVGSADSYYLTSGNGTGTQRLGAPWYLPNIAREMTYPYTSECSMIDVSVPFCTQYNFLPLFERASGLPDVSANWGNGYLYVRVAKGTRIEVFHAMGDDFRYHVFCPRSGIRARVLDKQGTTTYTFSNGDRIGGYYVG